MHSPRGASGLLSWRCSVNRCPNPLTPGHQLLSSLQPCMDTPGKGSRWGRPLATHRDLTYAQPQGRQQLTELAVLRRSVALPHGAVFLGYALLPLAGLGRCLAPALLCPCGTLQSQAELHKVGALTAACQHFVGQLQESCT